MTGTSNAATWAVWDASERSARCSCGVTPLEEIENHNDVKTLDADLGLKLFDRKRTRGGMVFRFAVQVKSRVIPPGEKPGEKPGQVLLIR